MKFKTALLPMTLITALLATIVNYTYLQHKTRSVFANLQKLIEEEYNLNADYGRLQIEHSTLVNNNRIETVAKRQLGMKLPENGQIINISR